jgi:hypothetical protein
MGLRKYISRASLRIMEPVELLREKMRGKSLRAFAKEIPCSAPYLCDVLKGNRAAGPRILAYLGLERVPTQVVYKKIRRRRSPAPEALPA